MHPLSFQTYPRVLTFFILSSLFLVSPCQVSGDKNEEQVLNAIEAYTEHRPEITSRAINLLFDIARIERCSQLLRALQVSLMQAFSSHLEGKFCIPSIFFTLRHHIILEKVPVVRWN